MADKDYLYRMLDRFADTSLENYHVNLVRALRAIIDEMPDEDDGR